MLLTSEQVKSLVRRCVHLDTSTYRVLMAIAMQDLTSIVEEDLEPFLKRTIRSYWLEEDCESVLQALDECVIMSSYQEFFEVWSSLGGIGYEIRHLASYIMYLELRRIIKEKKHVKSDEESTSVCFSSGS